MLKPKDAVCESARTTCESDALCTGDSAGCADHRVTPNGTPCDAGSVCIGTGAACVAAVCANGTRLIGFDSSEAKVALRWHGADFTTEDATVVVRHMGGGAPIELVGATLDPPDTFELVAQPNWPVQLASGETVTITIGSLGRNPVDHGTLTVRATGCADADLQLPVDGEVTGSGAKLACGMPLGESPLFVLVLLALWRARSKATTALRHQA